MNILSRIRFWHLMVGTGFALLGIGLVMIFLPPGVGDSEPYVIEFFQASIEGSEIGLALIVLGLSCFLIGRKDLSDLRTTRGIQQDLQQTSTLAARLVADQVDRTFNELPAQAARLGSLPDLDLEDTLNGLKALQNGSVNSQDLSSILRQAKQGLALLQALDKDNPLT